MLCTAINNTHIYLWYPCKPDIFAILDDRITAAAEIDVDVFAFMHAELVAGNEDNTVLDSRDVCWTVDLAADQEAFLDILHR